MLAPALLLLLAAFACVWAELFVPTHGILAICAALMALISIILAARTSPTLGLLFGITIVLLSPLLFYFGIRRYPNTPVGRRVLLKTPPTDIKQPFSQEHAQLASLVGKRGTTLTPLRPAGTVDFDGNRIDCLSESTSIPPNTPVEVLRVTGLKVFVKPITV
jgi:membrane-bound serine protease (ClpP class)